MSIPTRIGRGRVWLVVAIPACLAAVLLVPAGYRAVAAPAKPARPATAPAAPPKDPELERYGIYAKSAPRAPLGQPMTTTLPLKIDAGDRIALIGNTLLERMQEHGHFEALLQRRFPESRVTVRNLAWPADEVTLRPRPENFADLHQHLTHERADVILAAFGFNESFAGDEGLPGFRRDLSAFVADLKARQFNGKSGPRIVLISPTANENVDAVAAADLNNTRLRKYADVMRDVAREQQLGFADVFDAILDADGKPVGELTGNGVHLNERGYEKFSRSLYRQLFRDEAPSVDEAVRAAVIDKDRQYNRRYRPLNSFYYTGERNKLYGYLDFLPAMRNFDLMVANRDQRIWAIAQGKTVPPKVDDSNVPALPAVDQSRGVNEWLAPADELKAFKVDPRFEVNLFASEEQFPELANPIQMRWDSRGRLWVSCSGTYPHIYPGNEPNDRLLILEDTDHDGRADKCSVFANNLHLPLSFEFGDGGVYVSEQPHLVFLKDTDGDGKADVHRIVWTGFGTEDSHHALHDFVWTPDGDLMFRESIFHHSQVETPRGPVRMANSGWFRFTPREQRLFAFGSYPSTNPWGVTFDDWGRHMASHPIFAEAFHAPNPPYPLQHPAPKGLQAYSGTCGHEFVDFHTFPDELQGCFIKARYKPTNRIEMHKWVEGAFGFDEQYISDLIFSTNLSFIPVDVSFGPRGDLYICDWYNPVKGHAQYALRDERRDRRSGRIWRVTAKGRPLQEAPKIDGATIPELLDLLKRPEYRVRYWAKRELRERRPEQVKPALDRWVASLAPADPRYRHHQLEAVWLYRGIGAQNVELLRDLLKADDHNARAAAVQQLRYWHGALPDIGVLLKTTANDSNGIVRMEAALACAYVGSKEALDALLEVGRQPRDGALAYAFVTALNSEPMRQQWEKNPAYAHVPKLLELRDTQADAVEKPKTKAEQAFDAQAGLTTVRIACVPERMRFTVEQFTVKPGQPVKIVFSNADATDHNLVLVKPDAMEEVGMAGNDMAKDPANATSDFIPPDKKSLILAAAPLIGPTRKTKAAVLRITAPSEPGVYPYVCTFPGHWIMMNGVMVVANDPKQAEALLAARKQPTIVRQWTTADLAADADAVSARPAGRDPVKGMKAFIKAQCTACHAVGGHGPAIGPDLSKVTEKYKGRKLLEQIIDPSVEVADAYRAWNIRTKDGEVHSGVIAKQDERSVELVPNAFAPQLVTKLATRDIEKKTPLQQSPMPQGLLSVLTKDEILDLLALLETGGIGAKESDGGLHKH